MQDHGQWNMFICYKQTQLYLEVRVEGMKTKEWRMSKSPWKLCSEMELQYDMKSPRHLAF